MLRIVFLDLLHLDGINEWRAPPNTNVALFDSAIPGSLPILNWECVDLAIRAALALNCKVNEISGFDRKHYWYYDLPAGYQITQHRIPIAVEGAISFDDSRLVRIKQIHLEQVNLKKRKTTFSYLV